MRKDLMMDILKKIQRILEKLSPTILENVGGIYEGKEKNYPD
jgi:hypothetical protein